MVTKMVPESIKGYQEQGEIAHTIVPKP